jgi:hypothetical protein
MLPGFTLTEISGQDAFHRAVFGNRSPGDLDPLLLEQALDLSVTHGVIFLLNHLLD